MMVKSLKKRVLILVVFLVSFLFNMIFLVITYLQNGADSGWIFPELGPAVIQDSYHNAAPGLESPFGMIGDIPGGYSLYSGNPLQSGVFENLTNWVNGPNQWSISALQPDLGPLFLSIAIALIPIFFVLILGRKSYGASKAY
jgi:hypothetical protein